MPASGLRAVLATKRRDGGASRRNASAITTPAKPTPPSAQRQSATSAIRLAISRPPMPPSALPAMYSPIAAPTVAASTSSAT